MDSSEQPTATMPTSEEVVETPGVSGGEETFTSMWNKPFSKFIEKYPGWNTFLVGLCIVMVFCLIWLSWNGYISIDSKPDVNASRYRSRMKIKPTVGSTVKSNMTGSGAWRYSGDCSGDSGVCPGAGTAKNDWTLGMSSFQGNKSNLVVKPTVGPKSTMVHEPGCPAGDCPQKSTMGQESAVDQLMKENKARYQSLVNKEKDLEREKMEYEKKRAELMNSSRKSNMTASEKAECDKPWDPYATEEAKVLAGVGSYRQASSGMAAFSRAINDNITLSDAQLEAIMQGGEPFSVGRSNYVGQNAELGISNKPHETSNPIISYGN